MDAVGTAALTVTPVEDRNEKLLAIEKEIFADLALTELPAVVDDEITRKESIQGKN